MKWKRVPVFLLACSVLSFLGLGAHSLSYAGGGQLLGVPTVSHALKKDVSPPLRSIVPIPPSPGKLLREIPLRRPIKKLLGASGPASVDPVVQGAFGSILMPLPLVNFDGVNNIDSVYPPDTEGDVGPSHYVQWVNDSFQIWNKAGTSLYGPAAGNTIWTSFGGPCEERNDGDPIVLYDGLADRWLMSQFALPSDSGPFYQCFAISTTPDPTGTWYRYAFQVHATKMNDYPKIGVWPDGYYMTVNQFELVPTETWAGAGVFVFDRAQMLVGGTATFQYFDLFAVDPGFGGMLPSDLDGATPPPVGAPNYFVDMQDDAWGYATDRLELWKFHVDWTTPANTTFGVSGNPDNVLDTAAFDTNLCGYAASCIPQPGTLQGLAAISDRLMYRLQYRNFGTHETLVVNHTVDTNGSDHAGIRWYEIRSPGSSPTIYEQGTYAPDATHRWMGSIAMDGQGNMALGYSASSNALYPSVRYAGRRSIDPLGTLLRAEATIIDGAGSQTGTANRWGDYSTMSVDPTDDCTFWYTQEYYSSTSFGNWRTRIGSFQFPTCPCRTLTLSHTGTGGDPVATPTSSLGCAEGKHRGDDAILLTTTPAAGWVVGSWTGTDNDSSTSTTNTLTMPLAARTAVVNYVPAPTRWDGAIDVGGGWWYLGWLGFFNVNSNPWIFHEQLGWMYVSGTTSSDIWIYYPSMAAWLWTSDTTFPFLYRASGPSVAWIYYLEWTTAPAWFHNQTTDVWEAYF